MRSKAEFETHPGLSVDTSRLSLGVEDEEESEVDEDVEGELMTTGIDTDWEELDEAMPCVDD